MVTAQTFDAPGQAFSVAVSPYDDSDLNLKLKADFEAALAERWQARMIEEAAAAFLLLFESEVVPADMAPPPPRSEEHTSELPSLMRISYAVFCLKKKKDRNVNTTT